MTISSTLKTLGSMLVPLALFWTVPLLWQPTAIAGGNSARRGDPCYVSYFASRHNAIVRAIEQKDEENTRYEDKKDVLEALHDRLIEKADKRELDCEHGAHTGRRFSECLLEHQAAIDFAD